MTLNVNDQARIDLRVAMKCTMKFLLRAVLCLWWLFLASGPVFYVVDALFDWPHQIFSDFVVEYLVLYSLVVLIAFISISLISRKIYRTALIIMVCFYGTMEFGIIKFIGFRSYIGNEKEYIKNHCDIQNFDMDGKAESVGLCDWDKSDTNSLSGKGPLSAPFFYDTSGEMKDYYFFRGVFHLSISHDQNKRNWVDAIRRLFTNSEDDPFEYYSIWAFRIAPDFYGVFFDYDNPRDESQTGNSGFSTDYASAPSKN